MKRLLLGLTLLALSCLSASAWTQGQRVAPVNYCFVSSPAAATGLAGMTCDVTLTTAMLQALKWGYACVYTQGIVWKDNGVAPTATPGSGGTGAASGSCFEYNGNFSQLQVIQQTSGAIFGIALYQ